MGNTEQSVRELIADQLVSWDTARKNYAALRNIRSKTVDFGRFRMEVQFNPERVRSTAAPENPGVRPCFLCAAHRPPEQKSLPWRDYEILVNPYPIFDPHLTIPAAEHTPQFLTGKTGDMIALAEELPDFALTFNGARSGASAPDHFHFQAVGKGVLPAQDELPAWSQRHTLYNSAEISVWGADDYLRPAIVIGGASAEQTARTAETILACLKEIMNEPDEAQVNALAWHGSGIYTVVFFPRTAHRPREFYAQDDTQFLFSPGVVDLAGVPVTVRPQDYARAEAPLLTRLFAQVVPDEPLWKRIETEISLCLAANPK